MGSYNRGAVIVEIASALYLSARFSGSTNKEFSFRHDWNSLISDDESLQMKHYTKDYFPHADVYVSFGINIITLWLL